MQKISVINHDSKGIAIGKVFLLKKEWADSVEQLIPDHGKKAEEERFKAALNEATLQTVKMAAADPIFAAHFEIMQDETLRDQVISGIRIGNKCAEWSLREAGDELCAAFEEIEDAYLKERAADVRDVVNRILHVLKGEIRNPFENLENNTIVVAGELFPSDTARMDFSKVKGLITGKGGTTGHVCIIARNRGIPALTGLGDDILKLHDGDRVIIDGDNGEIIVNPDESTLVLYSKRTETNIRLKMELQGLKEIPAITTDGHRIDLMANASGVGEVALAMDQGAAGIGLFRTEFLFLQSKDSFPDEETQFREYKNAAEICGNNPLIIRTLDIGGDKSLPYFSPGFEENPFLGWRAIRISLSVTEVFRIQLRALLRASAFGNIKIMFPMIISLEEWSQAKSWVEKCKNELRNENLPFNEAIELGVMVETPAAVMMAGELAGETGFMSLGTNDLTQYTLAVDRLNSRVQALYNPLHPAVIRSIRMVADASAACGKPVGICGELAGNPKALKLLLGLGLSKLSISPADIPEIKYLIRKTSMDEARKLAGQIAGASNIHDIRTLLGME